MDKRAFYDYLKLVIPGWVSKKIISTTQKDQILKLYGQEQPVVKVSKKPASLSKIMISLACVLLGIGLFMFYSANWRYMLPFFKLIQVLLLLIVFYSLSYYFNLKKDSQVLSRVFLILGMFSFGLNISLISQIFHISAHPANGVFIWAIMVLLTTLVTDEIWGLFLATLLFFIWNSWEISIYGSYNVLFGPFSLLLGYLFYKQKNGAGILICFFYLIIYFYQIHFRYINNNDMELLSLGFVIIHIFYGALLISLRKITEKIELLRVPGVVSEIFGWIFITIPLFFISWPINFADKNITLLQLLRFSGYSIIPIELVLLCAFLFFIYFRYPGFKKFFNLLPYILLYGIILYFLPLPNKTVLMISTHLGILLFIFGLLYSSYASKEISEVRRALAIIFPCLFVFVKWVGFLAVGLGDYKYLVCYVGGFVIFAVICVYINQIVKFLLKPLKQDLPDNVINLVITIIIFYGIYALSFKLKNQISIFHTSDIIITTLFLFLGIAVVLFAWLWKIASDKLIVIIASIILVFTTMTLFIAHPNLSWIVYSLIFNLLLFMIEGALIYTGTKNKSQIIVVLGIFLFIQHVLTRYFDLIWDLLSGSALFIITGLIILISGYILEKQSKKIFKQIKQAK